MTTTLLAMIVAAAVLAPHVLRLERVAPVTAATVWLSALILRALTVVFIAVFIVLYVPTTTVFATLTHWCWDGPVPFLATRSGLDGHRVGDAATVVPALFLAASLLSVGYGVARTVHAVSDWLRRASIGRGPRGSVLVASERPMVAAAGLARPRVVVSAAAVGALEDDELDAGLAHEQGHIAHRHRFVLVLAEACRGLARVLPGSQRATAELAFHLERDADRWAVTHERHDPCALASAICKVALPSLSAAPALAGLGGDGRLAERVRQLLEFGSVSSGTLKRRATSGLAAAMASLALVLLVLTPAAIVTGVQTATTPSPDVHCRR